jgi:uncharacterized protein (UPF0332 family)
MNARDFLVLANTLLAESTEAAWRSAISRAYYAAFHVARLLFRDLGFRTPRADQAHAYLWLRLSNCGDPQIRVAGQRLRDLRSERNRADYDIDVPLLQATAAIQVQISEQLIQFLDGARAEPTRTMITDAMRIYERTVLGVVTWHVP